MKRYPFLLDVKGHELREHRERAQWGVEFLKVFMYLEEASRVDWKGCFHEYLLEEGVLFN